MTDRTPKQTLPQPEKFDSTSRPGDAIPLDRRIGPDRLKHCDATSSASSTNPEPLDPAERRVKKERRRRIDPTTFEKQYSGDEIEFMNAMQRYKLKSGQSHPTYGEVLKVAQELGYRKFRIEDLYPAIDGADPFSKS